jgi:hypothetical protein
MINSEEANNDRVSGDFPGVHDLKSVPLFCDALGLVKPEGTHERWQDAVRPDHGVRSMENIRTDYRSSWWPVFVKVVVI